MPLVTFEFEEPDRPQGGSGSDYSDEQPVSGIGSGHAYDGNKMTLSELDEVLDSMNIPKDGTKTVNDKLLRLKEYIPNAKVKLSTKGRKKARPKTVPPKTKKPRKTPKSDMVSFLPGDEESSESIKARIESSAPPQPSLPLSEGPKASTQQRKKYFDTREERRAIQGEEKYEGPIDFEFGANVAQPPPPPKPLAPPSAGGSDDEGFDKDPNAKSIYTPTEKELREQERKAKKIQSDELADIKRTSERKAKIQSEDAAFKIKQQRKDIYSSSRDQAEQLQDEDRVTASDRIVRRLAAFDIGRTMGLGSLVAGFSEFAIFRPNEEREDEEGKEKRRQARREKEQALADLEQKAFELKRSEQMKKQGRDDLARKYKQKFDLASSEEERTKIIQEFNEATSVPFADYVGTKSPAGGGMGSGGGGGNTPPPGPPPSGPTGPGDKFKDLISKYGGSNLSPKTLTSTFIGLDAAIRVAEITTKTATDMIKKAESVITIDPLTQSAVGPATRLAGQAVNSGAKGIGIGAGAVIGGTIAAGTAVGGPMGAVIGGTLGGGAALITEPIVSAVETGNKLLENLTKNSIDYATISEVANQEITTLLAKMEADFNMSEFTVDFARAQGDLQRAIIRVQEALIEEFGDDLTEIVQKLAKIADLVATAMPVIEFVVDAGIKTLLQQLGPIGQVLITLLEGILDMMPEKTTDDPELGNQILDFFGTQKQFNNKFNNAFPQGSRL